MSMMKKLAGQTIIYGLGSVLPRVLNLVIILPYLTNKFNDAPGQYGIHGVMYSFAALLLVLLTFRMETSFFRFGSEKGALEKIYSTTLSSLFLLVPIIMGVLWFSSEGIASILSKVEDAPYVKIMLLISALDILVALPFARLRLEERAVKFSMLKIVAVIINLGLLFFFLELLPSLNLSWLAYSDDRKLEFVLLANLLASGCTFLFLLPEILKNKWTIDRSALGRIIRYALPLIVVGLAGVISQFSDRWLINILAPGSEEEREIQAGLYNTAVKFAVIMQLFTQAFNYAAEPFFFRQAADKNATQTYADVARAFTFVACFAFLFVLFYEPELKKILIRGANFRSGLNVLPILLLAYLFLGLYYNFSVWYKIKDKTIVGAWIAIVGAIISLTVNIIFIPKIGNFAAAWAAFFTFGTYATLGYLVGRRFFPIPYRMDKILGLILLAVAFYFVNKYALDYLEFGRWTTMLFSSVLLLIFTTIAGLWERSFFKRILQ